MNISTDQAMPGMVPEETLISVSNLPSVSDYSEEVVIFFIVGFITFIITWTR